MVNQSITRQEIEEADPKRCFVCGRRDISDKHHIIPVEFGGEEDGLTVPLCPSDHRAIHREAENRARQGEAGKFINEELYPTSYKRERAELLANYVYQAKVRFDDSGKGKADTSRNIIQVGCTPQELAIAHDLKRSMGFNSLSRLLKHLFLEEWKKRQGN